MNQTSSHQIRPTLVSNLATLTTFVATNSTQTTTTSMIVMENANASTEHNVHATNNTVERHLPTIDTFTATVPTSELATLHETPNMRTIIIDRPLHLNETDKTDTNNMNE